MNNNPVYQWHAQYLGINKNPNDAVSQSVQVKLQDRLYLHFRLIGGMPNERILLHYQVFANGEVTATGSFPNTYGNGENLWIGSVITKFGTLTVRLFYINQSGIETDVGIQSINIPGNTAANGNAADTQTKKSGKTILLIIAIALGVILLKECSNGKILGSTSSSASKISGSWRSTHIQVDYNTYQPRDITLTFSDISGNHGKLRWYDNDSRFAIYGDFTLDGNNLTINLSNDGTSVEEKATIEWHGSEAFTLTYTDGKKADFDKVK